MNAIVVNPHTEGTTEQRDAYQRLCNRWRFVSLVTTNPYVTTGRTGKMWLCVCRKRVGGDGYAVAITKDGHEWPNEPLCR